MNRLNLVLLLLAAPVVVPPATRAKNVGEALERAIVRLIVLQDVSPTPNDAWPTVHAIEDLLPIIARQKVSVALPVLIRLQSYRLRDLLSSEVQCWIIRVGERQGAPVYKDVPPSECVKSLGADSPQCEDLVVYGRLVDTALQYIRDRKSCSLE